MNITPEQIWALDKKYAEAGVAFHARPLRAAMDILGTGFSIGLRSAADSKVHEICKIYRELIPETSTTWPGYGTGIAASGDRVKKITLAVVFGSVSIRVHEALGFNRYEDWVIWCQNDQKIADASSRDFTNVYDFTNGIHAMKGKCPERSIDFWYEAQSNLEIIADSLPNCYRTNSVLQPVCMLAELSMKGALHHLGVSKKELKDKFKHKHVELAKKMAEISPSKEDSEVLSVVSHLPDYVKNRYDDSGMTRLQMVELAVGAQLVAASALRRVSGVDISTGGVISE